jgi:hypothetical protein
MVLLMVICQEWAEKALFALLSPAEQGGKSACCVIE